MKKILFFLFIFLALKQQAQSLCDYTYTIGNQSQFEVAIPTTGNGILNAVPLYAWTTVGTNTFEDSCFSGPCTHIIYNPLLEDTVATCISYIENGVDTFICCFEQYWDGQFWQRQMMYQTWFSCDSITYTATQGNLMFEVGMNHADFQNVYGNVVTTMYKIVKVLGKNFDYIDLVKFTLTVIKYGIIGDNRTVSEMLKQGNYSIRSSKTIKLFCILTQSTPDKYIGK